MKLLTESASCIHICVLQTTYSDIRNSANSYDVDVTKFGKHFIAERNIMLNSFLLQIYSTKRIC